MSIWITTRASIAALTLCVSVAVGEEHRVEPLAQPAPEGVAAEIAEKLEPSGLQVFRADKPLCKIWLVKDLPVAAGFEASETVKYPLAVGELAGVLRFDTKGEDFRGQEIGRGLYTLRYAWQPVDGNHVGTSPTRDFLLLVPADQDTALAPIAEETLFKLSAEAAESSHPAMLSLLPTPPDASAEPAMQHEEHRDLWILQTGFKTADGKSLPIRLVVDGHVDG